MVSTKDEKGEDRDAEKSELMSRACSDPLPAMTAATQYRQHSLIHDE